MSGVPAWAEILPRFRAALERVPQRVAARELQMNHTTLAKLRDGVTKKPQPRTLEQVLEWVERVERVERGDGPSSRSAAGGGDELASKLVGYLQGSGRGGSVLVERVLQHISDPIQQKLVAIEIISTLKQMWIAAGVAVPDDLRELEANILRS